MVLPSMNSGDLQTLGVVPVLIVVGIIVFLLFGVLALLARFYRQVDQGRALVINTMRAEPVVAFTGSIVYPIINRAETMDLSVKTVEIDRRGKEGLICNDNIRADINVTFFVRVNKTVDDVLKVAQSIGCARASDAEALKELFTAKFAEALKTVGKHFNFEELYTKRDEFKDKIIEVIGKDLNGFVLDDAAIDYLEQTPLELLDKDNIMDAEGIRKITDLTVIQNVKTNELRQKERMEIGSQNLSADEALFRFEQRRAEAEAKKNKEIAVAKSREQNEALRVASDEKKKTTLITTKNDEESLVADQARERGVAIAEKNREREVAIETERVEKARQLEVIGREREVSLGQHRARQRGRAAEEGDRERRPGAHRGREERRDRRGEHQGHPRHRRGQPREGGRAHRRRSRGAGGDGQAGEGRGGRRAGRQVQGPRAHRHGRSRARDRGQARPRQDPHRRGRAGRSRRRRPRQGAREGGRRGRDREAGARGGARITLEKAQAQALGEEKQGLARVRVQEAEASAVEKRGLADATALREKMTAEASQGIAQKAESMKAPSTSPRAATKSSACASRRRRRSSSRDPHLPRHRRLAGADPGRDHGQRARQHRGRRRRVLAALPRAPSRSGSRWTARSSRAMRCARWSRSSWVRAATGKRSRAPRGARART